MAYKPAIDGSAAILDFGKLLGFKHVAQYVGDGDTLASALGAASNKVGAEAGPVARLARALGAAYNKAGEGVD